MLNSFSRFFVILIALVFGAISFVSHAQADRKKNGYRVQAGKNFGKRAISRDFVSRSRGQRRYDRSYKRRSGKRRNYRRHYNQRRGYRNRYSNRRGYHVVAGHDFSRSRDVQIVILQNEPEYSEPEPIVIEKLEHIPQIIKITDHQKRLGSLRAGRRGDPVTDGEPGLTVLSKEARGGLSGEWKERIEKDSFEEETIIYFQD